MTRPDWNAINDALGHALDLDGAARDTYLASLAPALRAEVETLLASALAEDSILDHPEAAHAALAEVVSESAVAEGARVGPYAVEALVGEGGMGRVYRAHRADGAFEQTVAVKVVRQSLALAGSDVRARLRRERDLLAALDHPGIARLVDGGETEDGVPYLVTEFVDGAPITAWADAAGLDVRERVRLLVDVARAVDHAHRRFVVHRDLKPSNVLVTERDGEARPVVLDFGIAKLLAEAEDATGAFPLTRTGMRLLTPAYAAPELFDPTLGVTAAADVYGLGAILYELLTGQRPHGDTPTAPTTEPTRPSRAVTEHSAAASASPSLASRSRTLRGDLDTICLRALHPDPARRYASAADLADDLERYLDGRPVEARRDSLAYVAGRFARRNRAAVVAGAVALAALVGGLGFSLVSLANEREARADAETEAERADEAARLLGDLFSDARPGAVESGDVTLREVLDRGLARVSTVEPLSLRGYLYSVLGSTYQSIGDATRGDSLLRISADLLAGPDAPPRARAEILLDLADNRVERGDTRGALPLILRADSLARGDEQASPALLLRIATDASWAHRNAQQYGQALEWAERAIGLAEPLGPEHRADALSALSRAYYYNERVDDAIEATDKALALYEEAEGPAGENVGITASQQAHNMMAAGRLEDAIPYARQGVRVARLAEEPDPLQRFQTMGLLGQLLQNAGELREAEAYLDSTVTVGRSLPETRTSTGMSMAVTLSQIRGDLGDHRGAESAGREALRIGEGLPADAFRRNELDAMAHLQTGMAMHEQGKPEARAMLERAFERVRALPPEMQDLWMQDPFISGAEQTLGALQRGR